MTHRHFDINYNGTSTAWDATPGEGMDEPQPAVWSFSSSGELVPDEFRYAKGHKFEMGEEERAFVAEFKRLLDGQNLAEMFLACASTREMTLRAHSSDDVDFRHCFLESIISKSMHRSLAVLGWKLPYRELQYSSKY